MAPFYSSPQEKARHVEDMFARISRRYDLANRVISLGLDRGWRRRAAGLVVAPPGGKVLDLGAGTGEMALLLAKDGSRRVIALDFCLPMMRIGQAKALKVEFVAGDVLSLPFPDQAFHCVTSAFLLRNLASLPQGLAEMARVIRPEGCLMALELTSPPQPLIRRIYRFYLHHLVPHLGWLITGDREAYRYLPYSVEEFLTPRQLTSALEEAGLVEAECYLLSWGTVALHRGWKR